MMEAFLVWLGGKLLALSARVTQWSRLQRAVMRADRVRWMRTWGAKHTPEEREQLRQILVEEALERGDTDFAEVCDEALSAAGSPYRGQVWP